MTVERNSTSVERHEDLSQIVKIDEAKVSGHLNGLVRRAIQETLNQMLDELCNAERYERTEARKAARGASTSASCRRRPARRSPNP